MQNGMKRALTIMGVIFSPLLAQAQQQQQPYQQREMQQQVQDSYMPGEKVRDGQLPGGYNQSAAYVCDNWDVFVTLDYLYWTWNQGTSLVGTLVPQVTNTTVNTSTTDTAVFNSPGYTSGFQVGMGLNMKGMDNWNIYSEYSWYQNTSDTSFTGSSTTPIVLPSGAFRADQVLSEAYCEGTINNQSKLGFQTLDFLAQRPFYFGKKLTANFSMGLRAQWINQNNSRSSSQLINHTSGLTSTSISAAAGQTSWSLGPKFALDTNWLLGYGFKILGNIAQSMLYTSYNTGDNLSFTRSNGTTSSTSTVGLHNYGTVSPVTESFLGLAWGSYFYGNEFHMDLSVGYDFNVYWNHNMVYAATSQTESNMYIQGMNIQLRFDF